MDREEAKKMIPDGWEVIDAKICSTLEEGDMVFNWTRKKFWDLEEWRELKDENVGLMKYTSGMLAMRKISIVEEKVLAPESIKRMDKSSFLSVIKNFK